MLLVRDLLDNQLLGRKKKPMGRVDGIVMEVRAHDQPRITFLEVGGETAAQRLGGPLGKLLGACARRWGAQKGKPYRIAWSKVRDVGVDIEVDIDADLTPALYWEKLVREKFIRRIPGA